MPDDTSTGGVISKAEIAKLIEAFRKFEGAFDPRSIPCRVAEAEFYSLTDRLYAEKVQPHFRSITLIQFRSAVRNYCRSCLSKEGGPFPCP